MIAFVIAVVFTLTVSAFCSLLEAMILSTTTAEIEGLKQKSPLRGELLEKFKMDIEETSSAILSLNTVANTLGATVTGVLAVRVFTEDPNMAKYVVPASMTIGILIISEVIPKNLGVLYRPSLLPHMIYPLKYVRMTMMPISYVCKRLVQFIAGKRNVEESGEEEIILLAERSAKEGTLTADESQIISNALSLDDVKISEIMTPRTVVSALDCSETIGEVFARLPNIPFARLPVYEENIDNITGVVRRRDLLKAKAEDRDAITVKRLTQPVIYVPDTANAAHALQQFLKNHQQLAIAVDEFGSVSGVVTMEDVMEHILGQEIFEKDDLAVDMRELARRKQLSEARKEARHEAENKPAAQEAS
ncbi:CNNM domain-containing protein [Cerasicoccus fimbriatus]|uniref:CNNM domain-containing protein n=1 Tax=Cerasicoccus fimbriatus TaxID=3014554 RepID=UPI0022B329C3|nr:hemolysin family protein [Cerasicoccus sp. TK19100]